MTLETKTRKIYDAVGTAYGVSVLESATGDIQKVCLYDADGNPIDSSTTTISGPVEVTPGTGFASAVLIDDVIDGTTEHVPMGVDDGTGHVATLVQPTTPADTQPVSGPLTDTQLRATAVPVSGTFYQATQPVSTTPEATRIDAASSTVTYIGKAAAGTATSAASWRIFKMDKSSGLIITWADSDTNYNNVWDDRASLTYG